MFLLQHSSIDQNNISTNSVLFDTSSSVVFLLQHSSIDQNNISTNNVLFKTWGVHWAEDKVCGLSFRVFMNHYFCMAFTDESWTFLAIASAIALLNVLSVLTQTEMGRSKELSTWPVTFLLLLCHPARSLGFTIWGEIFLRMWPFFNPSCQHSTLRGWEWSVFNNNNNRIVIIALKSTVWDFFTISSLCSDRLDGLVVKASASRAEGPGFESRLRRDFFGVESYQWLKNWHSSGYPARRLAL